MSFFATKQIMAKNEHDECRVTSDQDCFSFQQKRQSECVWVHNLRSVGSPTGPAHTSSETTAGPTAGPTARNEEWGGMRSVFSVQSEQSQCKTNRHTLLCFLKPPVNCAESWGCHWQNLWGDHQTQSYSSEMRREATRMKTDTSGDHSTDTLYAEVSVR